MLRKPLQRLWIINQGLINGATNNNCITISTMSLEGCRLQKIYVTNISKVTLEGDKLQKCMLPI